MAKTDIWWENLQLAKAHAEHLGRPPKQRERDANGNPTGKWIARQKERYDTLGPDRQEALALLAGGSIDARELHFDAMCAAVHKYKDQHGSWPRSKEAEIGGIPVGQWSHDLQRGKISITPERAAKLRTIGF